jgi:hypothetical protein
MSREMLAVTFSEVLKQETEDKIGRNIATSKILNNKNNSKCLLFIALNCIHGLPHLNLKKFLYIWKKL